MIKQFLKQTIMPTCITLILSSCLVLAWYLYNMAYRPLVETDTATISASDYALASAKLGAVLEQLDAKALSAVDMSNLSNPFQTVYR